MKFQRSGTSIAQQDANRFSIIDMLTMITETLEHHHLICADHDLSFLERRSIQRDGIMNALILLFYITIALWRLVLLWKKPDSLFAGLLHVYFWASTIFFGIL